MLLVCAYVFRADLWYWITVCAFLQGTWFLLLSAFLSCLECFVEGWGPVSTAPLPPHGTLEKSSPDEASLIYPQGLLLFVEDQSSFSSTLTSLYFTIHNFSFPIFPLLHFEATLGLKNSSPSAWTFIIPYFSLLWSSHFLCSPSPGYLVHSTWKSPVIFWSVGLENMFVHCRSCFSSFPLSPGN